VNEVETMTSRPRPHRFLAGTAVLLIIAMGAAAWPGAPVITRSRLRRPRRQLRLHYSVDVIKATEGTQASVADVAQFLTEVTDVDPALKSYEKQSGKWLYERSLLTAQRSVRS